MGTKVISAFKDQLKHFPIILFCIFFISCSYRENNTNISLDKTETDTMIIRNYEMVNGLKMYYEIHGDGEPLVLIHGGGSTIETTFGNILPVLAKRYKVIAVEMQAHGHTGDRGCP